MTPTSPRRIVVVVGPGRSGTSTMAGALAHSGYHVPDGIEGDETNPHGFFEPRWVVDFHHALLRKVGVRTLDTDPGALARMDRVNRDVKVRATLRDWLEPRLDQHEFLVVKDPRAVWFTELWSSVSRDLGCEPGFVIMLRHPSEVSSSRSEYYDLREVNGVAGWINVALVTEQLTAGKPRVMVRYPRLLADWRTELRRARDVLDLHLDPPPEQEPHPVDAFIDPALRRRESGWDLVALPAHLQDLGDRAFAALGVVADRGESATASQTLDEIRAEYARLHEDSLALVSAHVMRLRQDVARRARAKERGRLRSEAATAGEAADGFVTKVVRRIRG